MVRNFDGPVLDNMEEIPGLDLTIENILISGYALTGQHGKVSQNLT